MQKNKIALITGITGQSGSYLAEFLLSKGYEVHGTLRRTSSFNTSRIDHIFNDLKLHYSDVTDSISISKIISEIKPNEIYHLAAQSHVQVSFEIPLYTAQVDAVGTLNILEAVKNHSPSSKIYFAGTSELFGKVQEVPQTEKTPFYPRSPYGVAKLYGYWISKNYRESYDMFICNGILFNHSSPRRGSTFVEKKIVDGLVDIFNGKREKISLGNLYSKRDIGYAKEYVEGMWMMLQHPKPDDYVLSTGESFSIKEMIDMCCDILNINIKWMGEGEDEKCINVDTNKVIIDINKRYFRPAEVELLIGNAQKAKDILGWEPKTKLKDLLSLMIREKLDNKV